MTNRGARRILSPLALVLVALTALLSVGPGLERESHAQVSVLPLDFSDVVIFGTNSVRVDHHAEVVAGHVVVNNASPGPTLSPGVELGIDKNVVTPAGYAIVADSIDIAKDSVIGGSAYYNSLTNAGTINGSLNTPLALPVFTPLPAFESAAPGTLDVTVAANQTQTIAPGNYRDITLAAGATLRFSAAGVYNVRSISTAKNAKLLFQGLASGTTRVRVQNQVAVGDDNVVGPDDGDPLKAAKIIFYVAFSSGSSLTPAAFSAGKNTALKANVYAPNGTLSLDHHITATGAFLARDVDVAKNVQIDLETFFIQQAPAITSANATTFTVGQAGTFTVTTTGSPTPSITRSGALPTGVTFVDNGNGTATLSGMPAAGTGGTYPLTFTASNGVLPDAVQNFTLTVNQAPAITSANATTFTVGTAGSFTVTTTGFPPPSIARGGVSLPSGVNFVDNGNGTGTLSGIPAAGTGGVYAITFTATNTSGSSPTQNFTLTVNQAPAITSANSATFAPGLAGQTFTVTTTGFPTSSIGRTGTLPGGVTFTDNANNTATIAGTPAAGTQAGSPYPWTITAANGVLPNAMQAFTFNVVCPTITVSGTIPDLMLNQVMATATFTQAGGNGTITWSATGLPNGVAINSSSGDVTGAPTQSGSFSATITATDAGACTGSKNLTVVVKAPPAITSANSYTQQLGTALSFTVTTSGPPTGGFPTAAISQAPAGGQTGFPGSVSFTDNGNGTATLGGSVTSGGAQTYTTTITANNGVAPNATQSFSLIITCPTITVVRTGGGSFPAATFGVGYPAGNTFTASGGTGPYHWAFAPSGQPPGINLTIAAGSLSGIPTGTGNFNMIVVATDQSTGCTGQATFPFTINPKVTNDSYANLVNNTEAVVTGGTTSSPATPFVPLSGTLVSNDTPSGNVTLTTVGTFATSQGGSVTIAADGTFKYTPPVTVTALSTDTFTYTASSNFPGPCGTCAVSTGPSSASGTATLNLSGRVWYVLNTAGGGGNGQSQAPFNLLSDAVAASTVNDTIYVYRGDGTTANLATASVLKPGQDLIGQGVALIVNGNTLVAAGGFPLIGNTVTLATNVLVDGIDMTTGASSGIVGAGVTGVAVTVRHLTSTTGAAVNLNTVGGTLSFTSVSANGAVNGIALTTTTGTFTVTGDGNTSVGGNNSGGTIQNTSSHGISLTNAQGVSLTNMKIENIALSGIHGTGVTGFTLANSIIDGVNTAHTSNDGNVTFNVNGGGATENNVSGTVSITDNTLNNSYQSGVDILNYAGTISNLTITGNTFTSSTSPSLSLGSAVSVYANKNNAGANVASITTGSISGNTILNFPSGAGMQVLVGNTGSGPVGGTIGSLASPLLIQDNTITGNGPGVAGIGTNGIAVTVGHQSDGIFTIGQSGHPNTITNVRGNGIACSKFGNDSGSGANASKCIIAYNVIDAHNTANSPGINTGADSATSNANTPLLYLDIHNNDVSNTTGNGILSTIRNVDGTGFFHIENNTVDKPLATLSYGIRVDSGNGSESTGATVCLKITGNTSEGSANGSNTIKNPGIGLRQNHVAGPTSTFQIEGLSPTPANDSQMATYVSGQNPASVAGTFGTGGTASISTGATYTASTCTIP